MSSPVVVGITGASGAVYGVKTLELLRAAGVESHLVVTSAARQVMALELEGGAETPDALADRVFDDAELTAPMASGSFPTRGMVVAPCSIRTLSAVANSRSSSLLERAADVTLKERRPLVLLVRETPLHAGHLRLMLRATEAGAVVMPPAPVFYSKPETVDDLVRQTAARALDLLGVETDALHRWGVGDSDGV